MRSETAATAQTSTPEESFSRASFQLQTPPNRNLSGRYRVKSGVDGGRKDFPDLAIKSQRNGGLVIVLGRALIDDDVRDTALSDNQRKRRGGIHRKRGAQRYNKIGLVGGVGCACQRSRVEALTEADGREFEESAAGAPRRFPILAEVFKMRFRHATPVTALTFHKRICAVKLDQAIRTGSGQRM